MRGRPDLQTLVFYLITCPHANLAGLFRLTIGYIESDTGLPGEDVRRLLGELADFGDFGYCHYDPEAEVIWVVDHARHELGGKSGSSAASPQQKVAVARVLADSQCSPLAARFAEKYPEYLPDDFEIDTLLDTPCHTLGDRVSNGYDIPPVSPSPSPFPSPAPITPSPPPTPHPEGKGSSPTEPAPPDCPHQKIIDLYHETLPALPRVKVWNDQRRSNLRARWRESEERQDLTWWREFFETVGESDFLMGRTGGNGDRQPFVCALDWLIRPTNFAKVIEGRYGDGRGKPPEGPDPFDDPHSWVRHGIRLSSNGARRWCSRAGAWVDEADWAPRAEGET